MEDYNLGKVLLILLGLFLAVLINNLNLSIFYLICVIIFLLGVIFLKYTKAIFINICRFCKNIIDRYLDFFKLRISNRGAKKLYNVFNSRNIVGYYCYDQPIWVWNFKNIYLLLIINLIVSILFLFFTLFYLVLIILNMILLGFLIYYKGKYRILINESIFLEDGTIILKQNGKYIFNTDKEPNVQRHFKKIRDISF